MNSLATPMFLNTVGSLDPVEHIQFIADQGFSGVFDNFSKLRSAAEQSRIGEALAKRGMEMGCFIGNIDTWNKPSWGSTDPNVREQLKSDLLSSIEAAKRVGGRHITTIGGIAPTIPLHYQLAAMTENLKRLSPIARRQVSYSVSRLRTNGRFLDC